MMRTEHEAGHSSILCTAVQLQGLLLSHFGLVHTASIRESLLKVASQSPVVAFTIALLFLSHTAIV